MNDSMYTNEAPPSPSTMLLQSEVKTNQGTVETNK